MRNRILCMHLLHSQINIDSGYYNIKQHISTTVFKNMHVRKVQKSLYMSSRPISSRQHCRTMIVCTNFQKLQVKTAAFRHMNFIMSMIAHAYTYSGPCPSLCYHHTRISHVLLQTVPAMPMVSFLAH
jgi:hypothetical protein